MATTALSNVPDSLEEAGITVHAPPHREAVPGWDSLMAMQEQQVNEEFDTARAEYLARHEARAIRYVSDEEAGRRLGMPSR